MHNRLFALVELGVCTIALAACGASSTTASSPNVAQSASGVSGTSMAGACADIGPSGASAVLGVDVGPPTQELQNAHPNCIFFAASQHPYAAVGITIYIGQGPTDTLFRSYGGPVAVSGVGDKALANADGTFLIARQGAIGCAVTLNATVLPGTPAWRD